MGLVSSPNFLVFESLFPEEMPTSSWLLLPEVLCGTLGTVTWSLAETPAAGQALSPGALPSQTLGRIWNTTVGHSADPLRRRLVSACEEMCIHTHPHPHAF